MTLFGFVVLVSLFLSYRQEGNSQDIERANKASEVRTYDNCKIVEANATSLRKIIDQVVISVRGRKDIPPAIKAQYIASYTAARPIGPDCGPDPR